METSHRLVNLAPRYGITIAVISAVLTAVFYFTDNTDTLWTGYFINLVMFLGILFSVIHYNSQHHERPSQLALFSMGFRTTLWAVVIISIVNVVLHFIEINKTDTSNFWLVLFTNVFFTNIILGLLASLIGSMVFKRNQKTTKPD
jgi:hypothetical protein